MFLSNFKTKITVGKNFCQKVESVHDKIAAQVKKSPCVIYMKGTPDRPQCGFSKAVVDTLRANKAEFDSYNVLENSTLREGIKQFSNWPTLPQVYIAGEFVGGCDILLKHQQDKELLKMLVDAGAVKNE